MTIISASAPDGDTNSKKERVEALVTPQLASNPIWLFIIEGVVGV